MIITLLLYMKYNKSLFDLNRFNPFLSSSDKKKKKSVLLYKEKVGVKVKELQKDHNLCTGPVE